MTVFFSRCRPRGLDISTLALKYRRVFIGHPMLRPNVLYDPTKLLECIVDPSCSDEDWEKERKLYGNHLKPQFNQNRNLIRKIEKGSVVLLPLAQLGIIYAAKIRSEFEVINSPIWYREFVDLNGGDDPHKDAAGTDVAQCWEVDEWKPIPLPVIPGWIRRSLFGRSTYGIIHADDALGDPYEPMLALMNGQFAVSRQWTLDPEETANRMLVDLTPNAFEHLVVSLLQLEHKSERWIQTGGAGDGGVDGIGASSGGQVTGLLQCKWQYQGDPVFPETSQWEQSGTMRKYLATLRSQVEVAPAGCVWLHRQAVAALVIKHCKMLPQSWTLRVGDGEPEA